MNAAPVANPLGLRLLRRVVLVGLAAGLVMTALRTGQEYFEAREVILEEVRDVGRLQSGPLADSLWSVDRAHMALHLEGIVNMPHIGYAGVFENGRLFAQAGQRRPDGEYAREFPLERRGAAGTEHLGVLVVQAKPEAAGRRALTVGVRALGYSMIMVFFVCLALYLLTRRMISRHLEAAAAHFQRIGGLDSGAELPSLDLDKKPVGDELDTLAQAVNAMQAHLAESGRQLCAAEHATRSMARFPEVNPNPVLRVSAEGVLALANEASQPLLADMGCALGLGLPEPYLSVCREALATGEVQRFEITSAGRTFAFVARAVMPEGFVNLYGMDITARVKAEEEVRRTMARLQSLVRVLQRQGGTEQDFLDFSLAEALTLTGSRMGYIYHYDEQEHAFTLNSWSREVMRECRVRDPQQRYHLDATGIWGEVVRQRKAIVVNDYAAENPLKRGCPEGHVPLRNFMSVPVAQDGAIVAVAAVANRDGDYGEAELVQFSLLMDACWQVVCRMRAEAEIRRSLHEKEVMLKEIHHRVKNNLHVVSSLLFLQMQHVADPRDQELFTESQKRIQAMALVHEELYGAHDLSSVDMREYVPRLVERVTAGAEAPVTLDCRVGELRLPVTSSIPCGLLLNELVMNAVKHAFRGRGGTLSVDMREADGRVRLVVEDDGPGLPEGFDMGSVETLGMTLVASLAAQLGGRVQAASSGRGARFSLDFPLEKPA